MTCMTSVNIYCDIRTQEDPVNCRIKNASQEAKMYAAEKEKGEGNCCLQMNY